MTIKLYNNYFGTKGFLFLSHREQESALGLIYSGLERTMLLDAAKDKNLRPMALCHAAGTYSIELITEIFNLGVDLSEEDNSGITLGTACLFSAAKNSWYGLESVKFFLDQGVPINSKNDLGRTALMIAVQNYEFETAKFLIEQGCDVECFDNRGAAAIGHLWTDNADLAKLLITPNTLSSKSVYTCGKPLKEHFSQLRCSNVLRLL